MSNFRKTLSLVALLTALVACGNDEPGAEPEPPPIAKPKRPSDVTRLVLEKKIGELEAEIAASSERLDAVREKLKAAPEDVALQQQAVALTSTIDALGNELAIKRRTLRNLGN